MHLAFCVDDNFCCHLAALLVSIQLHHSDSIVAHIVSDGLSDESQSLLLKLQKEHFQLQFHKVDVTEFEALPISLRYGERISCATYFRMALPQILADDLDRVLYLDADMLVLGDLTPLYFSELEQHCALVVADGALTAQARWQVLGTELPHYFNAGMMLLNLETWRTEQLAKRTFSFLNDRVKWDYNDQDLLNLALNQCVGFVDEKWNMQSYHFQTQQRIEPKIVHFTGVEKPWHLSSGHPFTEYYQQCRLTSPYSSYQPELYLDSHDKRLLQKVESRITQPSKIAIYGAGQKGRRLYHALNQYKFAQIQYFIDRDVKVDYQGIPVLELAQLTEVDMIVIASAVHQHEIYRQLLEAKVLPEHIVYTD